MTPKDLLHELSQLALHTQQDAHLRQSLEQVERSAKERSVLLAQALGELFAQRRFRWRSYGRHDMAATDGGPVLCLDAGVVPRPLRAQPEGQGCNLRSSGVDVDAVDVVLDDESGD